MNLQEHCNLLKLLHDFMQNAFQTDSKSELFPESNTSTVPNNSQIIKANVKAKSEWEYFKTLLTRSNFDLDRIHNYLNLLTSEQQQQQQTIQNNSNISSHSKKYSLTGNNSSNSVNSSYGGEDQILQQQQQQQHNQPKQVYDEQRGLKMQRFQSSSNSNSNTNLTQPQTDLTNISNNGFLNTHVEQTYQIRKYGSFYENTNNNNSFKLNSNYEGPKYQGQQQQPQQQVEYKINAANQNNNNNNSDSAGRFYHYNKQYPSAIQLNVNRELVQDQNLNNNNNPHHHHNNSTNEANTPHHLYSLHQQQQQQQLQPHQQLHFNKQQQFYKFNKEKIVQDVQEGISTVEFHNIELNSLFKDHIGGHVQ